MPDFVRMGLILMIVGLVATAFLAEIEQITRAPIAEAQRQETLAALKQVLPSGYNNEPDRDVVELRETSINRSGKPVKFYRARNDTHDLGVAFIVTAPDGYSGNIMIMMGVDTNNTITAIQIIQHAETPGLGDKIVKTAWPDAFKGTTLDNAKWAVKKDGGQFDQFAGATITPRAVVGAVHRGLQYFVKNKEKIFARSQP